MAKPHEKQKIIDKLMEAVKPAELLSGTSLEDDLYYQVDSLTLRVVFTTRNQTVAEIVYNHFKNEFDVWQDRLFTTYSINVGFKKEDMFGE